MLSNNTRRKLQERMPMDISKTVSSRYPTTEDILLKTVSSRYPTTEDILPTTDTLKDIPRTIIRDSKNIETREDNPKRQMAFYSGIKKLNKRNKLPKTITGEVDICVFCLKKVYDKPYLLFSLQKSGDVFKWPTYDITKGGFVGATSYLHSYFKIDDSVITYEGLITENGRTKLWFRYSDKIEIVPLKKKDDPHTWCLCDEIVNHKKYLTFEIDKMVVDFFTHNPDFNYITNHLGEIYETPVVGYYGNHYSATAYISVFGRKRNGIGINGPFYYFSPYNVAIRYSIWTHNHKQLKISDKMLTIDNDGKYTEGGLVRFVIFLGNTQVLFSDDDNSVGTSESWAGEYNTIIRGRSVGTGDDNYESLIAIRKYDQQLPLSYYYVNTSQKNATLDAVNNKNILEVE